MSQPAARAAELGLSPIALGYLFSSFYWMYVVCLVPGGVLADRLGGRKIAALAAWRTAFSRTRGL